MIPTNNPQERNQCVTTTTAPTYDCDVDVANRILEFFTDRANPNWEMVISDSFNDDPAQGEAVRTRVHEAIVLSDKDEPYGAFVGSTVAAREVEDDGEAVAAAIAVLKSEFRIFQVGRGRGRAIVVLDPTPLPTKPQASPASTGQQGTSVTATVAASAAPKPVKDSSDELDISSVLLDVRNRYLAMQSGYRALRIENDDLKIQLETANRRIAELYERIDLPEATASEGWS